MKRVFITILFAIIGGFAGFALPLIVLLTLAVVLSWWYGDPAAGGVLSFLMIPLGPIGITAGMIVAVARVNRWYSTKNSGSKPSSTLNLNRRKFFENILGSDVYKE